MSARQYSQRTDARRRTLVKALLMVPAVGVARASTPIALPTTVSLSGARRGTQDCEVLDTIDRLKSYSGSAGRVYLKAAQYNASVARFYVRSNARDGVDGAKRGPAIEDARGRTWWPDTKPLVDIRRFGQLGGRDASGLLACALNEPGIDVWVPSDLKIAVVDAPLGSGTTLVIDGVVSMCEKAPMSAAVFVNDAGANGNARIFIVGGGAINGAKESQAADATHELIRFTNCSAVTVDIARAGGNRYRQDKQGISGAAIHIKGGADHAVSVGHLSNYGREGIWLYDVSHSTVKATETAGGDESWSGVQVGGPTSMFNRIESVTVHQAGASGIGCDSRNSLVLDCVSRENAYFHGFNFGHAGQPADGTTGLRLVSFSAGTKGTGNDDFNGLSVVNGSRGVRLVDCVVNRAFRDGFNISAGADDCLLERCHARGSGRYGLHASHARVVARNCEFGGNALGAISPASEGDITLG